MKASKKEEGGEGYVFDGAPLEMETKGAFLERKAAERQARDERQDDRRDERQGGRRGVDRKRPGDGCAGEGDDDPKNEVTEEDVDREIGEGGMLVQFKFVLPEEEREKLSRENFRRFLKRWDHRKDLLVVKLVIDGRYSRESESRFLNAVTDYLGAEVRLEFEYVESIASTDVGKHRWIISKVASRQHDARKNQNAA